MIKVKNVLLTAMVATFVFAGVEVGQATAHADAQPTTHVVKHAKKHAKNHSKKHVVKKHVKKSAKKHVRKVAKKHVAKKHVKKAAKKHVAKKGELKARVAKTAVKKSVKKVAPKKATKNTDNNPANPLARNNKRVALPQDTEYVGYVYTYGRGFNSAKNIGRVAPYLKMKAVREDGMSDAKWAQTQRDVYMANEASKEDAQQGNFPLYGGDLKDKLNTNGSRIDFDAYQAAATKYGWKLTANEWGI